MSGHGGKERECPVLLRGQALLRFYSGSTPGPEPEEAEAGDKSERGMRERTEPSSKSI